MKNRIIYSIAIVLLLFNVLFLWQNHTLKQTLAATAPDTASYLVEAEGRLEDIRGLYAFPGFGTFLTGDENQGHSPLTLVIFFSKETRCPMSLKEIDIYKRLLPVYSDRNQKLLAICSGEDSSAIADLLRSEQLDIPLVATDSSLMYSFDQLGISQMLMPFKIFYDSTGTAIYMRGADNTPESQADFEQAALRLSELVGTIEN